MNKIYHGDNLSILREIPDGSIDLIATDPPFNSGRDWGSFNDKWNELDTYYMGDHKLNIAIQVAYTHSKAMGNYITYMAMRLEECHRVLKDTGSLYLHCDPTASHYLKVMLDTVFGRDNFRNEIVWKRNVGQSNDATKKWITLHDVILMYTKSDNYSFIPVYKPHSQEYLDAFYKNKDTDGRRYMESFSGGYAGRTKDGKRYPKKRTYLDTNKGVLIGSLWTDTGIQLATGSKERMDYPTQKPVSLYQRIIKASSNQNDLVLDPFMGSGTTIDASHSLGRRWIGIDIGDDSINTVIERLRHRHGLEYDRDYEIIRTSGKDLD